MSERCTVMLKRIAMIVFLVSPACFAQSGTIGTAARRGIDAGNQAWIDGMKQGRAAPIAATYTEDAVDCGPTGDCIRGRAAVEQHMRDQIGKLGRRGRLP